MDKQKSIVFADFSKVKVKDMTSLRKKAKKENCELKVAKKTLIAKVFEEKGIKAEPKKLSGEIALGFGYQDEVAPFKIFYDFSKGNENLKILGGILGTDFLAKERAMELAQLPSKQELMGKMVGSIASPLSGFVSVLQGNIRGLVYVLSRIKSN